MQVAMPGDAAYALAGANATPEQIAALRAEMHLNTAAPVRYWYWLYDGLHGKLGISYASHRSVAGEIAHRFPVTASLAVAALFLTLLIGIPLGLIHGLRPGTKVGKGL